MKKYIVEEEGNESVERELLFASSSLRINDELGSTDNSSSVHHRNYDT